MLLLLSLLTLLFSPIQSTPPIYTTLLKKTNENIVLLAIPTCTELPEDFEGEICLDVEGWSEENEERLCFNVDFVGSGLPPVGFIGSLAELLSKKGSHKITLTHLSHTHSFYIHNSERLLPSPPPYIFITSIPYMLIMSDHSLSIDYYVLFEGDENAGGGEVRLELTNGESFGIPIKRSGSYDVKLDRKNRIDPGTHSIKLSIHSSSAVSTIFDRVLTPIEGGPNGVGRLMMSKIGKDVDLGVCEGACGSVDLGFGNSVKRKIMYVGMLKYDGQKTIWLEQFKSLNRNKWDMQFSTFMNPENQVNPGEIIKAIEDAGVEIKVKGLPSITEEDLLNTPCEFTEIIKKGGGVNMSIIVTCLLQRLNIANKDLNKLTPKWVKETWKGIVGEINEYEPDILVFANAREITDTLLTVSASLAEKKPKIVMELPNLFPAIDLTSVDAIVAPSHFAALHYSVQEKVDEAGGGIKVSVVNPGVDSKKWNYGDEVCEKKDIYTIGFVGRLSSEKSPGLFVAAAKIILRRNEKVRFRIIGEGAWLEYMLEMVEVLGISSHFDFMGGIYGNELVKLVGELDVILNPSLRYESETFCIANIEALAMGVPIVTFGIGGIGEYMVNGYNGIVVEDFESVERVVEGLVDGVLEVLEGGRREEMGRNAIRSVEEGGFRLEDNVRKYELLYEELLRI